MEQGARTQGSDGGGCWEQAVRRDHQPRLWGGEKRSSGGRIGSTAYGCVCGEGRGRLSAPALPGWARLRGVVRSVTEARGGGGVGHGPGQSRNWNSWAWARALLGRPTGGRGRRPGSPEAPGLQGKGLGIQLRAPCEALGPELNRGEQRAEAALGARMGSPARPGRASPSFSGEPCRPAVSVVCVGGTPKPAGRRLARRRRRGGPLAARPALTPSAGSR